MKLLLKTRYAGLFVVLFAFIVSLAPAEASSAGRKASHGHTGGFRELHPSAASLGAQVTLYDMYLDSCKMDAQSFDAGNFLYNSAETDTQKQDAQTQIDCAQLNLMKDLLKAQNLLNALLKDKRLMKLYRFGTTLQIARAYPESLPLDVRRKIVTRPLIPYDHVVLVH